MNKRVASLSVAVVVGLSSHAWAAGGLTFDRYDGFGGVNVSDLTGNAAYIAHTPTSTTNLSSFEIPVNAADNYGSDVYGYFTPTVSGTYYFGLASDDAGQLFLSTDDNPANKVKIAEITVWGNSRNYVQPAGQAAGYTANISSGISLVAGQSYYIEGLEKEGGGGDNLSVTATLGANTIVDNLDPLGSGVTAALGTLSTTPVPEPGTIGIAAMGLSALALRRKGRK